MPDNTIDGTPDAAKVACPVWSGGKSGDYFKGLPITIGRNRFPVRAYSLPVPRSAGERAQLRHPDVHGHQRRSPRRGRKLPQSGGSVVRRFRARGRGSHRGEELEGVQAGRVENCEVYSGFCVHPSGGLQYRRNGTPHQPR